MPTDEKDWRNAFRPNGRRELSLDELHEFEIDRDGRLYWRGKPVVTEQRISLRWIEMLLAIVVAASTVVQAFAAVLALGKPGS
jgi:hypothetical protein